MLSLILSSILFGRVYHISLLKINEHVLNYGLRFMLCFFLNIIKLMNVIFTFNYVHREKTFYKNIEQVQIE